jgi:hypothetical protein
MGMIKEVMPRTHISPEGTRIARGKGDQAAGQGSKCGKLYEGGKAIQGSLCWEVCRKKF